MFHSTRGFAANFEADGARAGTRTRVQALATLGDNHYTTLASVTIGLDMGINRCRLEIQPKSGVSKPA